MAISTFVVQIQLFIIDPFLNPFSFPFNTNDYMDEKGVSRRLYFFSLNTQMKPAKMHGVY